MSVALKQNSDIQNKTNTSGKTTKTSIKKVDTGKVRDILGIFKPFQGFWFLVSKNDAI